MTAPIQKLFALCKQTFSKHSLDQLSKDILSPIVSSLNKITSHDICFHPDEFRAQDSRKRKPAPVSYMELYRDDDFSLTVFVVKSGSFLPLHDHCNMFGLLKPIHGSVKIVSYNDSKSDMHEIHGAEGHQRFKAVSKNPDKIISTEDECCVLTPVEGNLHEIQPLTEFAAFFDILVPSYSQVRSCHYWKEVERNDGSDSDISDSDTRWLVQIPEPSSYWCDYLPYKGPRLT